MVLIKNREELYWTPNTITSKVTIAQNKATIELSSSTPFLKSYQVKEQAGGDQVAIGWKDVPNIVAVELKKDTNEIGFRVMNLAGVTGPVHTIIIER